MRPTVLCNKIICTHCISQVNLLDHLRGTQPSQLSGHPCQVRIESEKTYILTWQGPCLFQIRSFCFSFASIGCPLTYFCYFLHDDRDHCVYWVLSKCSSNPLTIVTFLVSGGLRLAPQVRILWCFTWLLWVGLVYHIWVSKNTKIIWFWGLSITWRCYLSHPGGGGI
jgi:hypothetical protein